MRRTASIDVDWPAGSEGVHRLTGRARDLLTPADAGCEPVILAEAGFTATIAPDKTILSISATRGDVSLDDLVGERAGGRLRAAISACLPGERQAGTLLHLLLDDISGASLVAPWAWSQWNPDWLAEMARKKADPRYKQAFNKEGVCAGLRPGSSGLNFGASGTPTGPLRNPADPSGWHAFPELPGTSFRRARRIDVARDETGMIRIDAHFQDSSSTPDGGRAVVHEYEIHGIADPVSARLVTLAAVPRVLPFPECPAAAANMTLLLGTPVGELRQAVLEHLRGIAGCTHLNDALRALADVPALAQALGMNAAQPAGR